MSENSTFCDQCGKTTLRGTSKFCSSCGSELPTGDTAVTGNEGTQSSAPDSIDQSLSVDNDESLREFQRRVDHSASTARFRTPNEESGSDVPPSTDKKQESESGNWTDNPLTFIGLSLFFGGWVWAAVVGFNHSSEVVVRALAIFTAPVFVFYEGIAWGVWTPVSIMVPGYFVWILGQAFGRRPTFNRMFLGVLFCLSIYFIPFGVGLLRNRRAKLALFFVNLIGGWTAIIWIIALIWALIPRTGDTTVPVINSRD